MFGMFVSGDHLRVCAHSFRHRFERASIFTCFFNQDHLAKVESVSDYDVGEGDSDESEVVDWDLDPSSDSESDSPLTDSEIEFDYAPTEHVVARILRNLFYRERFQYIH